MTDLVERLLLPTSSCGGLHWKAAEEIMRLRTEIDRLRAENKMLNHEVDLLVRAEQSKFGYEEAKQSNHE